MHFKGQTICDELTILQAEEVIIGSNNSNNFTVRTSLADLYFIIITINLEIYLITKITTKTKFENMCRMLTIK